MSDYDPGLHISTVVVRRRDVCGRGGDVVPSVQMWTRERNGSHNNSVIVGTSLCDLLLNFCRRSFHSLPLFLAGSARRKLTCTICNRKCSSSLNLQEHRKVRRRPLLLYRNLTSAGTGLYERVVAQTFWKTIS